MLWEVAYIPIPYSPFFQFLLLQLIGGGGAWALVPLSYVSDSGVATICQRGPWGEGVSPLSW